MRDPHVVELRYRIEVDSTVTFDGPPPVEDETSEFRLRLENGIAHFRLKEHFSSVEAAKNVVDKYIRAWGIDMALNYGSREISFIFENAEVIDRNPPPPGSPQVIEVTAKGSGLSSGSATVHMTRHQYPKPPKLFRVSPEVETLWQRYEGYRKGQEPLLAMAYFCLTAIEASDDGREEAAKSLRISRDVLSKLGNLTANRGDEKTARKVLPRKALTPLSPQEAAWIEAAIKVII
jgi:hypothetical protein